MLPPSDMRKNEAAKMPMRPEMHKSDIVNRELWEEAQAKIKAASTDMQAPDVGDMTQSFT